jgi:hypothetical protein
MPGANGAKQVLSSRTLAAATTTPAVSVTQQVYVALVVPNGLQADPAVTAAAATDMVNKASAYWSSQTGGQVKFAVAKVLPAYTSAYACGDNTYSMWNEADQMMPDSYGPDKHLLLVAPAGADGDGCDYGLGTIGAVHTHGSAVFVSDLNQSLFAHELGHNLGLNHSNSLRCTSLSDVTLVNDAFAGCQQNAYDDIFDVMGYSGATFGEGNLNAVHLDGMGLLPTAVRKISADTGVTTARIAPLSSATASRALKITDPNGVDYYVEYRTDSGLDHMAAANPLHPSWGVRVLREDPAEAAMSGSYELDATPTALDSVDDYNRSVPVGRTLTSASKKVSIKVVSQDSTGATLMVTDGARPPAPAVPAKVSISAPTHGLYGSSITATAKVVDPYGNAKANWNVTLQRLQKGTTTWTSVATVKSGSTGTASYRFANNLSSSYRWATVAATGAPTKYSTPAAVTTTVPMYENVTATSIAHGKYLTVKGRNGYHAVPSPVVYVQYHKAGATTWITGPRAKVLTGGSSFSASLKMSVKGTYYTRLWLKSGTAYTGAASASYKTVVK